MAKVYRYRGHRILDCAWAGDPHGGRWYVQSYHESGMQWADEATPHHRTLAEAKEYIGEAIEITEDTASIRAPLLVLLPPIRDRNV